MNALRTEKGAREKRAWTVGPRVFISKSTSD